MTTIAKIAMGALFASLVGCDDAPQQTNPVQDWHVVSVQGRITQRNDVYVDYAWKVTIRNDSSTPADFTGDVHFLDKDDFEVSGDVVNKDDVLIEANSEDTFTGQRSIFNEPASRIVKVTASMRKR
jgi:hypothetical protein